MKLFSCNYIEKPYTTLITFRFDSSPVGAEDFRIEYEDPETEKQISKTITGAVEDNKIIFDMKFPAKDFTLTNLTTNDSMDFSTEAEFYKNELVFVNEDDVPTTYIKGFPAKDVFQIVVKRPDGEVWNTLQHGGSNLGFDVNDYTENLEDVESMFRLGLDFDSFGNLFVKIDDEGNEEVLGEGDLRKVIIEIDKWDRLEVRTFDDLMPKRSTNQMRKITSYQGFLDYDKLGIE